MSILLHSDNSEHPDFLLLSPLIVKQVFWEDQLLNGHRHLVITGIHLQPGDEGGAEGRHIDTTAEAATGSVHVAGDGLGRQGGQRRLQGQRALCRGNPWHINNHRGFMGKFCIKSYFYCKPTFHFTIARTIHILWLSYHHHAKKKSLTQVSNK